MKTNILAALLALLLVILQLFVLQSRSHNSKIQKETTRPTNAPTDVTFESQMPVEQILSYDMHNSPVFIRQFP